MDFVVFFAFLFFIIAGAFVYLLATKNPFEQAPQSVSSVTSKSLKKKTKTKRNNIQGQIQGQDKGQQKERIEGAENLGTSNESKKTSKKERSNVQSGDALGIVDESSKSEIPNHYQNLHSAHSTSIYSVHDQEESEEDVEDVADDISKGRDWDPFAPKQPFFVELPKAKGVWDVSTMKNSGWHQVSSVGTKSTTIVALSSQKQKQKGEDQEGKNLKKREKQKQKRELVREWERANL